MNTCTPACLTPLILATAVAASSALACGGGGTTSVKGYSTLSAQNDQVAEVVSTVTTVVAQQLSAVPQVDVEVTAHDISRKSNSVSMTLSVSIRGQGDGCADTAASSCHVSLQQFVLLPFVPGESIADQRALTVALAGTVSRALMEDVSQSLAQLGSQARTELLAAATGLAASPTGGSGG